MDTTRRVALTGIITLVAASAGFAQNILTAPKTLIDRAIEARSAADIARDNKIVVEVNEVMAKLGTIKASTEIYEQRLLITGTFDDKSVYTKFEDGVRSVKGVKSLYWHAVYMSEEEPETKTVSSAGRRSRS